MATTWRGRSYSSRPSNSGYSSFGGSYWGRSASRGSYSSKRSGGASASQNSAAYRTVCNQLQWKLDSYKTLWSQAQGSGKFGKPSPTILNSFVKWIDKGAIVQTVSLAQLSRWARLRNKPFNPRNPSVAACKNILTARFGKSLVKAVARTKTGSFMVATPATWQGRPFSFPR